MFPPLLFLGVLMGLRPKSQQKPIEMKICLTGFRDV